MASDITLSLAYIAYLLDEMVKVAEQAPTHHDDMGMRKMTSHQVKRETVQRMRLKREQLIDYLTKSAQEPARRMPDKDCAMCMASDCDCACTTCTKARARREQLGLTNPLAAALDGVGQMLAKRKG